ncbi:G-protein coupled receptor Mth2-like [Limulus polyphemus]|uniref:G-protein coupled receptor Mth2-like n=1 Tax=Limulus polyphemus TaxID=6850 RepID=A0ABM1BYK6_LIMPO|nr:G-protein coupled receptor Mth2-like [Limulus polyphemus]
MSVLAFDVWMSLLRAARELRVSKGRQWRRFLCYCLYSWLTPMILVVVTVVTEQQENVSDEYKPGFGLYHCWFGHKKALSLFFVTPLGTVMFMNVVFFICSARIIVNTSSDVTNNQTKSSRQNFRLYSKLALLTGLTWIVGLLAGYLDYESLWYIFVLLNTLQGLFIFVSFSCTRKVRTYLQVKLRPVTSKSASNRTPINTKESGSNLLAVELPHENNHVVSSERDLTYTHFTGSSTRTSNTTNII